jgi:hypothetical protein
MTIHEPAAKVKSLPPISPTVFKLASLPSPSVAGNRATQPRSMT